MWLQLTVIALVLAGMAPIHDLCDGHHIAGANYCAGQFAVYTFGIEIGVAE